MDHNMLLSFIYPLFFWIGYHEYGQTEIGNDCASVRGL